MAGLGDPGEGGAAAAGLGLGEGEAKVLGDLVGDVVGVGVHLGPLSGLFALHVQTN